MSKKGGDSESDHNLDNIIPVTVENSIPVTVENTENTTVDTSTLSIPGIAQKSSVSAMQDMQNGLQGIMSAMQGQIATLQATVNTFQSNQVGNNSTVTNPLDKFYSGSQASSQYTTSQHGIPADNLPHIDVVSDSMRRNITGGKYVNLAALLIPDMDTSKVPENMDAFELLKRQQRDHRLDRPLSITQFYKAFGIFKRVMCEAYPQRRDELDLYEADIGSIYDHYGEVFYHYHVQFTKKAAAYMEKGIKVDWSKRHKDLFQLLIGGHKTRLCEHCFQADHQSVFCPTQINIAPRSKQRPNSSMPPPDSIGRPRVTFQGKEICNHFNGEKGCLRKSCSYLHICLKCKKPSHGQAACHPSTATEHSITTGSRNRPKPSE